MSMKPAESLYSKRGFSGRIGFGEKPAILVVDLIVGFTDMTSPLGSDLEAPLAATCLLLDAARKHDLPILFTTVEYAPGLLDAGLFPAKVAGLKWLISGSRWVQLDPRLKRLDSELLIVKKYASAFFGTAVGSTLAAQRIDTVIIAGCTTSGCVRATAVDALQHGFRPIIAVETVGDRVRDSHEMNLVDLNAKYADVVPLAEVLDYFSTFGTSHPR